MEIMGRWASGQAAALSKLKSRVRIPHALLDFVSVDMGLWPNWIRQQPFKL